jgi:NAD-dependent SIR2 family protein deacetylase
MSAGKWTRQAAGLAPIVGKPVAQAAPTFTHWAIKRLLQIERLRHLTSQNTDGLHLRSGVPRDKISELHGNTYLARCWACEATELHPTPVRRARVSGCQRCEKRGSSLCHCTGAKCKACGEVSSSLSMPPLRLSVTPIIHAVATFRIDL